LVGRKSRRAHDYHHAKSLVRAGFEPLCAAAGMRDLSLSCEIPFQNSYGRVTSTPRLKSGAIGLRQLATLLPRRDFRPTFFALFVPIRAFSRTACPPQLSLYAQGRPRKRGALHKSMREGGRTTTRTITIS